MKRLLVVLSLAGAPLTGCMASGPEPTLQVILRVSPTPPPVGPARLIIDVEDAEGRAVGNAVVSVEGVPEAEPGRSARVETATEVGAGRYVVPGFDLDLAGPWTVAVTVTDRTGGSLRRVFPISVYGGS